MNKKIISSILTALMIAGSTSLTAFAAMDEGTVVIGNKAFSLVYANDKANADEMGALVIEGGKIYVKDFNGKWLDDITGLQVSESIIPAVVYKNATGTTNFDAQDKDVVGETLKVTSVSLNKTTDNLTVGNTDTLTTTITPSNAANKEVTWTTSNSKVATVYNGVITAVELGTAVITATTVDGNKTAKCSVTVDKKLGYVFNQELNIDLKVRSTPEISATNILAVPLYNYEKVEILDSVFDTSGNKWDKITYNSGVAYVNDPYIQLYTSPADNVVNIAKNITKQFEVGNSDQVTGNFDGQGLSLGYLQWCIGQKTLQPLLNRMDRQYNPEMKSIFGTNYSILHDKTLVTLDNQLEWAKSINTASNIINDSWYSQFVTLSNNADFIKIEKDAEVFSVNKAMSICNKYNLKTVRGFALAFDIVVQNGSLSTEAAKIIDTTLVGFPNISEKDLLGVIANAVADTSDSGSSADVLLRKMAIVNGQGTVHYFTLNLDANYGLSDNNWR